MASSKVEIASSASPFGCVLRDHNWRDRINRNSRENNSNNNNNNSNVEAAFQTRINYFVHDHHLHTRISDTIPPDNNSQNAGTWLNIEENNTIIDKEKTQMGMKKRDVSPDLSDDSSVETRNPGCVSSLVQRWRGFAEVRSSNRKSNNPNSSSLITNAKHDQSHYQENFSSISDETLNDPMNEKLDTSSVTTCDDSSSEDGGEKERLKVADVIRKLKLENNTTMGSGSEPVLKYQEKRCFSPAVNSPPRIRGRQAFNDLLMQLERDRHVELDTLVERRAVSKFSHRGRIQSLLRLRFLRRDAIVRHHHQQQITKVVGPQQQQQNSQLTLAPDQLQQPQSCEEAAEARNPKHSYSSPIKRDTQQPEATIGKQNQQYLSRNSKSVIRKNSHCKAAPADEQCLPSPSLSQPNQINRNSKTFVEQISHCDQAPADESNHKSQGLKVELLREKFDAKDKHNSTTTRTPKGVVKSYTLQVKSSSTCNQRKEELDQQEDLTRNLVSNETKEEPIPINKVHNTCSKQSEKTSKISGTCDHNKSLDENDPNSTESTNQQTSDIVEPEEACSSPYSLQQETKNEVHYTDLESLNGRDDCIKPEEYDKNDQEPSYQQIWESGDDCKSDDYRSWNEWDEEDSNNLNWVSDIARPKSDWESLRQERYRDMLDSDQDNDEMRRLLERRSVSTFLSSNLRDAMDQLMISRVEGVLHRPIENHKYKEHNRLEQFVISRLETQINTRKVDEEVMVEEEEEEEVVVEEEGEEDSNFSDQVRSQQLEQPQSSRSSCPDTQPSSALTNRTLIDMEYIYDLRVHMEQVHHEVSELRETINSCMNMQRNMQCSIKQEVAAAIERLVGRPAQESANNSTRTRNCCLCYEMQVDSLLYRCGHMCTCFKCAHKLQCSTGKCPICQALIVDVVRAYSDGNFIDCR